ncbi:MAG: hypothetical protein Q8P45_01860 [Candidatus Harrisonbacteria bacterium]|nr:hypothetical protein [Candidatus Harrisonbacteria bacterium]
MKTNLARKIGKSAAERRHQCRLARLRAKGYFRGGSTPPTMNSRKTPRSRRSLPATMTTNSVGIPTSDAAVSRRGAKLALAAIALIAIGAIALL